jgi:DNA-binding beta-propeller fold protein YncE
VLGVTRKKRARFMALALVAGAVLGAPVAAQAAPGSAYVADGAGSVGHYTIGTGGNLSFSNSATAGSEPWMQAITPNGKYLYLANFSDGTISQYSLGSGGTPTPLTPATVTTGGSPYGIAVSPDGKNVYLTNGNGLLVYAVGSDGTLTQVQDVTSGLSMPIGVAVSPDGGSVYVMDTGNNTIAQYDRSSSGTVSAKAVPSVPSDQGGDNYGILVITPNGKYVYAAASDSDTIDQYTVGSGGELAPDTVPSVAVSPATTAYFYALTVSPDGQSLYAPDYMNDVVDQFDIGSNGQLAPKSTPTVTAGSGAIFVWLTADGKNAYVTNYNDDTISQYDVSSGGELTPKSQTTVPGGSNPLSIMIAPDQGPVAGFSAKIKGRTVQLDASKSSDSDGKVVTYHWNFGDGHSLTTSQAKVSHTYSKGGKHKVTLTVTDDSGCSTSVVFTGQNAYCNGTKAAQTSHTVKVAGRSLRLKVSPNRAKAGQRTCYAFSATAGGHGVKGATVKLAGHTSHTGAAGTATLCMTLSKGVYTAHVSKSGYSSAAARVRVSAASPVFTG